MGRMMVKLVEIIVPSGETLQCHGHYDLPAFIIYSW